MTEKNEAEDGNSISLKSPWHMKWDRQQFLPLFTSCLMSQKCKFCFLLYLKEIYAQFVESNGLVKPNIYQELKQTIMDLDLQITRKHPVLSLPLSSYLYSESQGMPNLDHVIYRRSLDDCMTCYCCYTKWTFYVFLFLCLLCVCISGSLKLLG